MDIDPCCPSHGRGPLWRLGTFIPKPSSPQGGDYLPLEPRMTVVWGMSRAGRAGTELQLQFHRQPTTHVLECRNSEGAGEHPTQPTHPPTHAPVPHSHSHKHHLAMPPAPGSAALLAALRAKMSEHGLDALVIPSEGETSSSTHPTGQPATHQALHPIRARPSKAISNIRAKSSSCRRPRSHSTHPPTPLGTQTPTSQNTCPSKTVVVST